MKKAMVLLAFGLCFIVLEGCVAYPVMGPPALRVEVAPATPGVGFVWIGGYWRWSRGDYVWISGYWSRPRPGYSWVPGRWEQRGRQWVWRKGVWRRELRRR